VPDGRILPKNAPWQREDDETEEDCVPKFRKKGIHLSAALLKSYGFNPRETFKFSAPEAGKIVLKKI